MPDFDKARLQWFRENLEDAGGFNYNQRGDLMRVWADQIEAHCAETGEDEDTFKSLLDHALDLLDSLRFALNPTEAQESFDEFADERTDAVEEWQRRKEQGRVWEHGRPDWVFEEGYESDQFRNIDQKAVAETYVRYLRARWLENSAIEWIFLDALIFAEIVAYGEEVKKQLPGKGGALAALFAYEAARGNVYKMFLQQTKWYLVKLSLKILFFFGVPALAGYYAYTSGYEVEAIVGGLGYLALVILYWLYKTIRGWFIKPKKTPAEESLERYRTMLGVYFSLKGPVVSPNLVKQEIMKAYEKGAGWDGAVYSLLDRAIARDPTTWLISSPNSRYI